MNQRLLVAVIALSSASTSCKSRSGRSLAKQTQSGDVQGASNNDATLPGGMRFIPFTELGFEMEETEVTRGQWKEMMGSYPEDPSDLCDNQTAPSRADNIPVSCVSWRDANFFAREMDKRKDGYSYRLPTEEEWSKAAGDIEGLTYGWCRHDSLTSVGSLTPNNGLYDMVGNVWEWTATSTGMNAARDTHRIARGGSGYPYQHDCKSSDSIVLKPDTYDRGTGFRLIRKRIGGAR